MCGIAGFWDVRGQFSADQREDALRRMTGALTHRGPDDEGFAIFENGPALGHRRLSIIDLSPLGHQPMTSASGRFHVVFNGEIFNYRELRAELEAVGQGFRGHSDTEVMLAAFEVWGLETAVTRFNGQFAIALFDAETRTLHLVRDRIGIKPLYYGWSGGLFLFGSELEALRANPHFSATISRNNLATYFRHGCYPTPHTVYDGIYKLVQGSILSIDTERASEPGSYSAFAGGGPRRFWSMAAALEKAEPWPEDDVAGALTALDDLLNDAVRHRMIADVPLGAFLSGGIDSSLVVATMQAQASTPVKTFTIGFHEEGFDEARFAAEVAAHLGTDHTELYITPERAREVIPELPRIYDEPFADESQIPTRLVSVLARERVTVALSGDGGDELFQGYTRYVRGIRHHARLGGLPAPIRALARALPSGGEHALSKLLKTVGSPGQGHFYRQLVSQWQDLPALVPGAVEPETAFTGALPDIDFTRLMMFIDAVLYMPDDILVKVDRASMAASLEVRVPILDHRVVELAWRFPAAIRARAGEPKWPLKTLLKRRVPAHLVDRPKQGFGVPVGIWLRGPLRDWAEDLLERAARDGLIARRPVMRRWQEHLAGQTKSAGQLWSILMFQAWRDETGACL